MLQRCCPSTSSPSPQGRRLPGSPPRAAYSHCASVGRRFPAQRQYAAASFQETCTTGWSRRRRTCEPGPSGLRQHAPSTASHHGTGFTSSVRARRRAALPSNPSKTYDQPMTSASVRYPVAAANSAKRALVTAVRSIRKASTWTSRSGPSPSSARASASSEPMTKTPPGNVAMSSVWRWDPRVRRSPGGRDAGSMLRTGRRALRCRHAHRSAAGGRFVRSAGHRGPAIEPVLGAPREESSAIIMASASASSIRARASRRSLTSCISSGSVPRSNSCSSPLALRV